MHIVFSVTKFLGDELPETMTLARTLEEAEWFGAKADCWRLEVEEWGDRQCRRLGRVWSTDLTPEWVGRTIRLGLAGSPECPTLEDVCKLVNAFFQGPVLTREVLRTAEVNALRELP